MQACKQHSAETHFCEVHVTVFQKQLLEDEI